MGKVINCQCGYTVQGETDDELVAATEQHIESDHPDMAGTLSREQILAMAEDA